MLKNALPISFIILVFLIWNAKASEGFAECIENTKQVLRGRYNFNGYNDYVGYLYNTCLEDPVCSESYYQHKSKNYTVFKYLIGNMISKHSQKVGSIYFDAIEAMSVMLCEKSNWSTKGNYQMVASKSYSVGTEYESIANEMVDHIFRTNALYQMYSNVVSNVPSCGLNQKISVSNDGALVSCSCPEDMNCATSMHNTTYINVSVGLVIVLNIIILLVLGLQMSFNMRVMQLFKRNSKTSSLVRIVGQYY